MGFNNGYDAGWQDAINAVKYGKVPGLGPASGGGEAVPATRAAGLFYITGYDEALEIAFSTPALLESGVSASELPATFTSADGSLLAHVTAPDGGWVPGDAIMFYHNNDLLAGIDRGDTVPDDNGTELNIHQQETDMMLMRLADTWTLIPLSSFG